MIGGLVKGLVNPSSLAMIAMGPGGWAGLAAKTLMSAVGQQIIQQLGEKLGLPQSTIDLAQGAFCASIGDTRGATRNLGEVVSEIAERTGASPFEAASAERELGDVIDKMSTNLAESREAKEAKSSGGRSWLMAIAESLGETSDKLAKEMDGMSKTLGEGENKSSQNLKFGAKSQEFSQFFSSANTVIKTLGEALAQGARKQ
ncbi:hypothetical protein RZN05_09555 [Sphingomonas sp. HF-S4]|uniref:Uncharacterized protein n=1 Tax=Sphingomonas agrestis TaxID=3080540 RepID=A0ABU3Y815_9SPHN|nr:hypothetical protein [Sphingomonas sp. HF-S4]MDV3457227.1 hypothetical protein [Sphingomonas sp. HF-S4]